MSEQMGSSAEEWKLKKQPDESSRMENTYFGNQKFTRWIKQQFGHCGRKYQQTWRQINTNHLNQNTVKKNTLKKKEKEQSLSDL